MCSKSQEWRYLTFNSVPTVKGSHIVQWYILSTWFLGFLLYEYGIRVCIYLMLFKLMMSYNNSQKHLYKEFCQKWLKLIYIHLNFNQNVPGSRMSSPCWSVAQWEEYVYVQVQSFGNRRLTRLPGSDSSCFQWWDFHCCFFVKVGLPIFLRISSIQLSLLITGLWDSASHHAELSSLHLNMWMEGRQYTSQEYPGLSWWTP